MIVWERDVIGFFTVESAVSFGLVSVAAGMPVEEVAIVHPNVAVVMLQADIVAFTAIAVDDADIADFDRWCTFDADSPAVDGGIVAYTFDGDTGTCGFIAHIDDNIAFIGYGGVGYLSDNPYQKRSGFIPFFISVEYFLLSGAGRFCSFWTHDNVHRECIFVFLGEVQYYGVGF